MQQALMWLNLFCDAKKKVLTKPDFDSLQEISVFGTDKKNEMRYRWKIDNYTNAISEYCKATEHNFAKGQEEEAYANYAHLIEVMDCLQNELFSNEKFLDPSSDPASQFPKIWAVIGLKRGDKTYSCYSDFVHKLMRHAKGIPEPKFMEFYEKIDLKQLRSRVKEFQKQNVEFILYFSQNASDFESQDRFNEVEIDFGIPTHHVSHNVVAKVAKSSTNLILRSLVDTINVKVNHMGSFSSLLGKAVEGNPEDGNGWLFKALDAMSDEKLDKTLKETKTSCILFYMLMNRLHQRYLEDDPEIRLKTFEDFEKYTFIKEEATNQWEYLVDDEPLKAENCNKPFRYVTMPWDDVLEAATPKNVEEEVEKDLKSRTKDEIETKVQNLIEIITSSLDILHHFTKNSELIGRLSQAQLDTLAWYEKTLQAYKSKVDHPLYFVKNGGKTEKMTHSFFETMTKLLNLSDGMEVFFRNSWKTNPDDREKEILVKQDRVLKLKQSMNGYSRVKRHRVYEHLSDDESDGESEDESDDEDEDDQKSSESPESGPDPENVQEPEEVSQKTEKSEDDHLHCSCNHGGQEDDIDSGEYAHVSFLPTRVFQALLVKNRPTLILDYRKHPKSYVFTRATNVSVAIIPDVTMITTSSSFMELMRKVPLQVFMKLVRLGSYEYVILLGDDRMSKIGSFLEETTRKLLLLLSMSPFSFKNPPMFLEGGFFEYSRVYQRHIMPMKFHGIQQKALEHWGLTKSFEENFSHWLEDCETKFAKLVSTKNTGKGQNVIIQNMCDQSNKKGREKKKELEEVEKLAEFVEGEQKEKRSKKKNKKKTSNQPSKTPSRDKETSEIDSGCSSLSEDTVDLEDKSISDDISSLNEDPIEVDDPQDEGFMEGSPQDDTISNLDIDEPSNTSQEVKKPDQDAKKTSPKVAKKLMPSFKSPWKVPLIESPPPGLVFSDELPPGLILEAPKSPPVSKIPAKPQWKTVETHLRAPKKIDFERDAKIEIRENASGFEYAQIFARCLNSNLTEVFIEDPFIVDPHQLDNLETFCQTLAKNCPNLRNIHLKTKPDEEFKKPGYHFKSASEEEICAHLKVRNLKFYILKNRLERMRIGFEVVYKDFHDREFRFNNGWMVMIGRGLDIYKKGECRSVPHKERQCKSTKVVYMQIPTWR